jgi:two-component system catabolic regulation response regulator CreB/two-component system response regulator ChvI
MQLHLQTSKRQSNKQNNNNDNDNITHYSDNTMQENNNNDNDDNKSKGFRILIVDDDADITLSFKHGLEKQRFEIDAYNDPLEALSNFKEKEAGEEEKRNNTDKMSSSSSSFYDLVLLDVRMPKMNGFELSHEMMKINDKVKVCFITAYEVYYEQLKEEFPSLNIGCFIKKPVEISELIRRIKIELG